jgi:hypothetical protein
MDHFAGLDVSVKETSICIVDSAGKIVREVRVASEPVALLAVLKNLAYHFKRIGLEAGPLSQWLTIIVIPASTNCRMTPKTSPTSCGSSAEVGSSNNIRRGEIANAR